MIKNVNIYNVRSELSTLINFRRSSVFVANAQRSAFRDLSNADIQTIPRFVRFQTVKMDFYGSKAIEQKCVLGQTLLAKLRPHIINEKLEFYAQIAHNGASFQNSAILLNYLDKQLLEHHWRAYKFNIFLSQQEGGVTNFVRSLLRLALERVQISASTSVEIELANSDTYYTPSQLPVKEIADWLNNIETAAKSQLQALKYLQMKIGRIDQDNLLALVDELKKVGKIKACKTVID